MAFEVKDQKQKKKQQKRQTTQKHIKPKEHPVEDSLVGAAGAYDYQRALSYTMELLE